MDLGRSSKVLILDLKMNHLPHLAHNKNFSNRHFYLLFNACYQEQFRKHLINIFEEKFNKSMATPIFDHAQPKLFVSHFILSEFVLVTLITSEENRSQTDGQAYGLTSMNLKNPSRYC